MRRFLQFLFTVAMGAALLYLFAGKPRQGKTDSQEAAKEASKEAVEEVPKDTGKDIAEDADKQNAQPNAEGKPDTSEARSTEAILSVIRTQTPALRHIYNAALRTRPGMKGKLVFKLRIAPAGRLAEVALVSSTTGDAAFDKAITAKVGTWRFEPVSGDKDDIVTVPFTFSE
jgi:TonB family protein